MSKTNKSEAPIKKINLVPISNMMVTTAYLMKPTDELFYTGREKPHFLSVQQVLAIGPRVEDVKVGDWVYIDYSRFVKTVKKKSQVVAGIGGQDMVGEEFVPPGFLAPGDDGAYFKISDREIEGVIKDFAALPQVMRDYITVETFEKKLLQVQQEVSAAKEKFHKEQLAAVQEAPESVGPAVMAEGKFRG